jgi:hypothetical protein
MGSPIFDVRSSILIEKSAAIINCHAEAVSDVKCDVRRLDFSELSDVPKAEASPLNRA